MKPDRTFSPAVITSKRASDDYAKIKLQHADLLNGMALQSAKVAQYNAQKAAQIANEQAMKGEMEKERIVADTAQKKDALTFQMKQSELDIKRAALAANGK